MVVALYISQINSLSNTKEDMYVGQYLLTVIIITYQQT
jgi:hypothetical protein